MCLDQETTQPQPRAAATEAEAQGAAEATIELLHEGLRKASGTRARLVAARALLQEMLAKL